MAARQQPGSTSACGCWPWGMSGPSRQLRRILPRALTGAAQQQPQRTPAVPQPQLRGAHHMPPRLLSRAQQEVHGRTAGPITRIAVGPEADPATPGLPVPAAFRMRSQIQCHRRRGPRVLRPRSLPPVVPRQNPAARTGRLPGGGLPGRSGRRTAAGAECRPRITERRARTPLADPRNSGRRAASGERRHTPGRGVRVPDRTARRADRTVRTIRRPGGTDLGRSSGPNINGPGPGTARWPGRESRRALPFCPWGEGTRHPSEAEPDRPAGGQPRCDLEFAYTVRSGAGR